MGPERAVLMCAGDYEQIPISVKPGDYVVAVDAGLERLLAQKIEPDLVLGDFDSLDKGYYAFLEKLEKDHPDRLLRLPVEKDDTDTIYAARICLKKGCRKFLFYGALGCRLDHTIANIQTLAWLKDQGADGALIGKNVLVTVIEGENVLLPDGYEGTFSLFALDPKVTGVTIKGMKYPLSDAVLTSSFPLGVSNEVLASKPASVEVREGKALIILQGKTADITYTEGFERIRL